jgi:DNA-binding transcriptional LysR family regulator
LTSSANAQHLRVFEAVVRRKSLTAAARELGMSQPAVSWHLNALEESCGVLLVDRAGKVRLPTPAGSSLYAVARRLVEIERELSAAVFRFLLVV